MASTTDKPNTEAAGQHEELAPVAATTVQFHLVDVVMRVLLFMASLTSIVVMVTSKQTEMVPVPGLPITVTRAAKFNYSPAFIYFVAAMSVACLYSIITTLASLSLISRPRLTKIILLNFALLDVLMLGIVASATGAAGGVAYIGFKGNSHSRWNKVCTLYDKYCRHLGASIAVSLIAAILLLLLSMLSTLALYRRIRD